MVLRGGRVGLNSGREDGQASVGIRLIPQESRVGRIGPPSVVVPVDRGSVLGRGRGRADGGMAWGLEDVHRGWRRWWWGVVVVIPRSEARVDVRGGALVAH